VANGSRKPGPAFADRIREQGAKHQRMLQRAIDDEARELPHYGDSDADITANLKGVSAKLGLPRTARLAIGIALAIVIAAFGVGAVIVAVMKLL